MAITNGYATLAEYKDFSSARGQSPRVDESDDGVIEDLIEATSRYIEQQTCRYFYKDTAATVRYYTPIDSRCCRVDDFVSVSALATDINGTRAYSDVWSATDYDIEPFNNSVLGKPYNRISTTPNGIYTFPILSKSVKLTAIFGWPSVPVDIRDATLSIVQSKYMLRSGQSSGGKITITAAGIVIRPEDVPPMAQKTIESYRRKI